MEYEEFKKILKRNNLTVKEFAQISETSPNTCATWSKPNRKVPTWVKPFIELYLENKKLQESKGEDYEELLQLKELLNKITSKDKE